MARNPQRQSTIDEAEVERFSALAAEWWDPRGKMAPLHKFNPVRIGYVRDQAAARFDRDPKRLDSMKGLRILDIGCGGGILCEPLARLGADDDRRRSRGGQHRGGACACRAERACDRLPLLDRGGARRAGRAVRSGAGHGGGRARHRRGAVRRKLRLAGEARRADDRGDAEPHAEELCAGDRRRGIHPALASGRHPSLGQVRDAERAGDRDGAERASCHPRAGRGLQSDRRPLAARPPTPT